MDDQHQTSLAKAREAVQQAEQRCDEQATLIAELTSTPETRAMAVKILREMEHSLQLAQMCVAFLELTTQSLDGKPA